jgi:hypothetical protein
MERIKANIKDNSIYLTEADGSMDSIFFTNEEKLLDNIKLFSLLGKHVVLAASHVFESRDISQILYKYPKLLEDSIVVVDLRYDCSDFLDFSEYQKHKHKIIDIKNIKRVDELAKFLNRTCAAILEWHPKKEARIFKKLVLSALNNSKSNLRLYLKNVRQNDIKTVITQIEQEEKMTRGFLHNLAAKHFSSSEKEFMMEINFAYYLAGAKDMKLRPALNPEYFRKCESLIEKLKSKIHPRDSLKPFFTVLLNSHGLDKDIVSKLSPQLLSGVRDSEETIISKFRDTWWNILDDVATEDELLSRIENLKEYENEVIKVLLEEVSKEKKKKIFLRNTGKVISASSLITTALSWPIPSLCLLSIGLAIISFPDIFNKIEETWGNQPLSLICSKLQDNIIKSV